MKEFLLLPIVPVILYILLILVLLGVAIIIIKNIIRIIIAMHEEKEAAKGTVQLSDLKNKSVVTKTNAIRAMVAPDGVDPGPNSYFIISDGGRDVYIRTLTLSKLPKRTRFANTFVELMDFPNCTSSVYVCPISESTMSSKLNKHIMITDSEYIGAAGEPNRQRQLQQQYAESMRWAREIETGDNKFFNVGFLFSLYANSVDELNAISDSFRSLAIKKNIEISNCFALQAESYLANGPFNFAGNKKSGIKYHILDKKSVSTIYNYTQSTFSHKTGIPLGYDLFTHKPVIFDPYNHKSFVGAIYGPMGYGKSASIKMIVDRASLAGYRFAAVDSQTLKGTNGGEYNPVARLLNGVVFQLSSAADNILNLFDVRESKVLIRDESNPLSGTEQRALELNEKITLIVDSLLTIIQNQKTITDASMYVRMSKILTECCKVVYAQKGIYHGQPDSLYEERSIDGGLTVKVLKELPTLSDFYKQILRMELKNADISLDKIYSLIKDGLSDCIRGVYYCTESTSVQDNAGDDNSHNLRFFTKEEYEKLPVDQKDHMVKKYNLSEVIKVEGTSPYFDGQSTIDAAEKCPFINIDISQLPEGPKKTTARQIALGWINECIINKNSEDISSAEKLLIICDEVHENYKYEYGRKTIESIVRTGRKRNVAMLLSTQTISEYDEYPETRRILDLISFHFIFAQPHGEKETLKSKFGFTDSQINYIMNYIGQGGQNADASEASKHLGECCLFDKEQKQCCFLKIVYFAQHEASSVETRAEAVQQLYNIKPMAGANS